MTCKRILVVDDDRDFAESIALRCRKLGFEAETADTPLAAVVSMESHPPDLLCIDVGMPSGDGLDLCEFLVRDSKRPPKPVIILTGRTDEATIRRSRLLGTRYVSKSPDVWQRLRPVIDELLTPHSQPEASGGAAYRSDA
ncbi:MAG TPA: response regulator [Pirellulales bacterium]|nr:response regulator [Pirellulales bacterium]